MASHKAYSLWQYIRVLVALACALPKVLEGISQRQIIALVQNGKGLARVLHQAIMAMPLQKGTPNTYFLTVDYGRSVEDGVKTGQYGLSHRRITSEYFRAERQATHEVILKLFCFDRYISGEDVLLELDEMGYRPADLWELLVLGEKYPNLQKQFPVVAMGSVLRYRDGSSDVPHLTYLAWYSEPSRELNLCSRFGGTYPNIWRFAAVRKE